MRSRNRATKRRRTEGNKRGEEQPITEERFGFAGSLHCTKGQGKYDKRPRRASKEDRRSAYLREATLAFGASERWPRDGKASKW